MVRVARAIARAITDIGAVYRAMLGELRPAEAYDLSTLFTDSERN